MPLSQVVTNGLRTSQMHTTIFPSGKAMSQPNGWHERDYEGSSFLNNQEKVTQKEHPQKEYPKVPQAWHDHMTCCKCLKKGHIAAFCEDSKTADTNVQDGETTHEEADQQLLDGSGLADENEHYYADLFLVCDDQDHRSVSFQLQDGINGGRIPKYWILIDSQSTTNAYSNPDLLTDIHKVQGSLTIHTQTGKAVTKLRGTVPGYGEVSWFCPGGIANILSLANVAKTMEVTFDSSNVNQFEVTKADGKKRIFKQSEHGLY
jgi:hypothetical protein